MNQRMARILTKLAQERAPRLLAYGMPSTEADLKRLARELAEESVLVLAADVPPALIVQSNVQVQNWVNTYAQLYTLFADAVFPTLNKGGLQAYYADPHQPPVVVLSGGAIPVIEVMAGFVVPFITRSQLRTNVTEYEYRVLIDVLCEELACADLPQVQMEKLRRSALQLLREMVALPMRQYDLTGFDRPIFGEIPQPPANLPPAVPPTVAQEVARVSKTRPLPPLPQQPPPQTPARPQQPQPDPRLVTKELPVITPLPSSPPPRPKTENAPRDMEFLGEDPKQPETPTREMFIQPVLLRNGNGTDKRRTTRSLPVPDLPPDETPRKS